MTDKESSYLVTAARFAPEKITSRKITGQIVG